MTANSMEKSTAPVPIRHRDNSGQSGLSGLSKSDSIASHSSIPVIGAHPFGTLQVHQPADSPAPPRRPASGVVPRDVLMKPLPDDPPTALPAPLADDEHPAAALAVHSTLNGGISPADKVLGPDEDVVLILDLPSNYTVGYDSVSFTTRTFLGVRDIPPGAHFFWVSETEASTMRSGFWIVAGGSGSNGDTARDRIHVMQWDKFNDVLGEPASQVEARIQRDNIAALYPRLTPFQYRASNANLEPRHHRSRSSVDRARRGGDTALARNTSIWQRLTGSITPAVLDRIAGRRSGAWTVHTADRVKGAPVLPAELALDQSIAASRLVLGTGTELAFIFGQAAPLFDPDSRGAARTEQAVDATTYVLAHLADPTPPGAATNGAHGTSVAGRVDDAAVVGEMQFAFVAGMHLGNEPCVQQWWHTVTRLVLGSYALARERPALAAALIAALSAQLAYNDRYLDGSVLDYGPDWARRLRLAAVVYGRRLRETLPPRGTRTPEEAAVRDAFDELADTVASFGWDVRADYVRAGRVVLEDGEEVELEVDDLEAEDERGEYAAVVVDLDESGRQRDLVSWN